VGGALRHASSGEERYDLVIPARLWDEPPMMTLRKMVSSRRFKKAAAALGGYDVAETGNEIRLG
jgi:putative molybdopterin biosynthesis protein